MFVSFVCFSMCMAHTAHKTAGTVILISLQMKKKIENKIISVDRQLNDSTKIAIIMASYIN